MVFTLLTDFGLADTYVGQMKGVLGQMVPGAAVVDLTHEIAPQDVLAGGCELDAAVDAFASDTIHVAVVDPGVGTARRGIAVRFERGTLVGPDNGLFTAVFERYSPARIISLDDRAFMRKPISATFHGRDVFASVAGHLARGVHLSELGEEVTDPVRLDLPRVRRADDGLVGAVLLADHFGNLITNVRRDDLAHWLSDLGQRVRPEDGPSLSVELAGQRIPGLGYTFADTDVGKPIAYLGSSERLEIAYRNASAAAALGFTPRTTPPLRIRLAS